MSIPDPSRSLELNEPKAKALGFGGLGFRVLRVLRVWGSKGLGFRALRA